MNKKDCLFCRIVNRELEVSKIYEDKKIIAFLDVQPVNPGHVLLIPKKHAEFISEVDDSTLGQMFKVSKKINKALRRSGIKCNGVNYFLADGEEAMQEVPHVHLHLFPRHKGDGFGLNFPKRYFKLPSRNKLNEIAEKIKKQL
ncbi:HIT family protein [Candidatus Falkowbacteria bacterium CG10_big_fil_rev_8_21_14_0_10_39_11]|uniref:HIT family protein n=1 Tax=Candidatus Falkowbacteria bacterium CG10_big_fil_rev_8_21_14_0_10_39_11 TaxID=1974565 RepID=A0A2H0V3D2_9BACT|nr:MAG: HIT family protein [Candidatus Falkowbacteria bacterium CG10_big_fil_rev_8_21_14_0_10_39_11]